MLRNAVLNSLLPDAPDNARRTMFIPFGSALNNVAYIIKCSTYLMVLANGIREMASSHLDT